MEGTGKILLNSGMRGFEETAGFAATVSRLSSSDATIVLAELVFTSLATGVLEAVAESEFEAGSV